MVAAIQGVTGSGKTITSVEVIIEWLRISSNPILVCADSQHSVDVLYTEMIKANIKAIRVGPGFEERF